MKNLMLKGLGTALVTPFLNGEVDYQAYEVLTKRQIDAGVDFLVPLGSTAETPCLNAEERVNLLRLTCKLAGGKIPVLVGCGTNSLSATIENIKLLEPAGPDAFLVVVPYYNKPTQEGMYLYFKAVAESTMRPVVLYNVPGRTGANILPETVLRLAHDVPNIVGIKEASGNLEQIREIIEGAPEDFFVLSGNDDQTLKIMRMGGAGVISVVSNLCPVELVQFVKAIRDQRVIDGKKTEADELDEKLATLFDACFVESNPIPAKGGLSLMGFCANECRLPLTPATDQTLEVMRKVLGL